MAKKKNKQIYNPRYATLYGNIGQSMRQGSSEELRVQEKSNVNSGVYFNPEFTSEYSQTGGPDYYQPITPSDTTVENDSDSSFFGNLADGIWKGVKNVASIPSDLYNFDWTSAWNQTVKRQLQSHLGSEEEELQNLKQEQSDLEGFRDFIDKYDQYKNDLQKLNVYRLNGDMYNAQLLQRDIENKYGDFQTQIDYYKQAIKTNPTLQRLMYNSAPDNLKDAGEIGAKVAFDALDHVSKDQPDNSILRFFNKAVQGASNFLDFISNPSSEKHTRAAIARGSLNEFDLQKLQRYDLEHLNGASLQLFQKDIDKRIKDLQPDIDEQSINVKSTLDLYRKGSWFYNPKNIDKNFEQESSTNSPFRDLNEKGINALLYSLPEIGSSFSSAKAFMAQLGLQWIGGAISKSLAAKNPVAGLSVQLLTQLGSVATAYSMRQDETNSEATDAYLQRVQDESIKNNINLGRILNITKQFCKSNGIETEGLNEQDLLQLALSYNIQTGDSNFEKIKRDARLGINKLKAQNNALGYMDYIEALPFAGSGGSIIKDYADKVARNMVYKKNLRYTSEDMFDAVSKFAENSISSETKRRLAQGFISRKIDNVLKKYGGSIEKQIARRNLINSGLSLGKKAAFVAASEGIEEGQQAFLQDRYGRGVYDESSPDYDYGRGVDLRSLVDNGKLATESVLAYFGLDFGDPLNGSDSLRQQMEIGSLTSFWFGLLHQGLASVTNNPESLRAYINQYKFDKNLMRYVANNYKAQQDDIHLGMFFDSFKNGGNADKIAKSYEAFKYLKNDEVVSDQDLQDDITLARTAYNVYTETNKKKNKILDDLHITRGSEDHKEYVKQASRVILDFKNVAELANISDHDVTSRLNDIIRNVRQYKEGESQNIENEPLIKSFKELIKKTYVSDKIEKNDRISEINKQIDDLYAKYHKPSASPVLTEQSEIEKQRAEDEAREKEYQDKVKPLQTEKEKIENDLNLSEEDYADRIITTLYNLKKLRILKGLYSKLNSQSDKLSSIKKAFGYKINIESLYGMKNSIKDQINAIEKKYSLIVNEGNNKKLLQKYEDIVNSEDLNEKITVNSLNNAILHALSVKYQAYAFNSVDPKNVRFNIPRVKWENLTDEQRTNFQNNLVREKQAKGEDVSSLDFKKEWINRNRLLNLQASKLKKKREDIDKNRGTDKALTPIDEQEQIENLEKSAAHLIIEQDMSDRFQRRQMVRLEKEQEEPLTIQDLDNANNGDEKAQKKIINEAQSQQDEDQKKATETAKQQVTEQDIDAHQKQIDEARRKVYGEKSDELTEKAKRKAEKATITSDAIDQLIEENVEGGSASMNTSVEGYVGENTTIEEAEKQDQMQDEAEHKREALIKAIDLLKKKPTNDTTDPSIYLQQKLNISEEWADEFVKAYEAIRKKENKESEEQLSGLDKIRDIYNTLVKNGTLTGQWGIVNGREFVVANINGVLLPFYKSSSGTDGKHKNQWYPFFGIGDSVHGEKGNWLIKDGIKEMEVGYGIDQISKIQKILNENFAYEQSVMWFRQNGHLIFSENPNSQQLDSESLNNLLFGKTDIGVQNGKNAQRHIKDYLDKIIKSLHDNNDSNPDVQLSDDNHLTQPQVEDNNEDIQPVVEDAEGQIIDIQNDEEQIGGEADIEIGKDGSVTIIPPTQNQDPQAPENNDTNTNTGEQKQKSIIDEPAVDESGDEGQQEKDEKQDELHDESKHISAISQLTDDIMNAVFVNKETASRIAKQFLERWVRGLSYEDCIKEIDRIAPDIDYVLQQFYDKYPIPNKDQLIHVPQSDEDNSLNDLDVKDDGSITIAGKLIDDELLSFSGLDDMYDEQVDEGKVEAERSVVTSEIGNPFNYRPDSDVRIPYEHNGKPIFTDKQMATGAELNKMLSIPGWFSRITKKYYIVSGYDKSEADDLTVVMIMEDPDNPNIIYNVAMREPSARHFIKGEESRLLHIINRLKFLNVNTELYHALLNNALQSITTAYNLKYKTSLTERQWAEKFISQYEELQERCRLQSAISKNLRVFTNNEIEEYLQRLREQRKQIIEAYCTRNEDGTYNIPDQVREDVQPQSVQLTNGNLNNQRDDFGTSIQRPIFGELGGFHLGTTISDISDEIESGQIQFGVGTGPFGENPGPNRIRPINGTSEEIPGTGKAGKLYIKVPDESQPGTAKKQVYVQLTEQKLSTELDPSDDTVTESFTLDGVADLNNPPSLAEIAFRLITKRINKQSIVLGRRGLNTIGLSDETIEALSDLLINHGKQTLIGIVKPDMFGNIKPSQKNAYLSQRLGFYSDKQLAYIEHADGTISFYIGDRDDEDKAFLHEYKMQELFPSDNASEELKEQCAKNRRHVIALIEKNMHWNTNIERLMSTLDDQSLYSVLDQYFFDDKKQRKKSNGKPISVFNPFGNVNFTFSYDDFYNQDGSRKNPLVLAWMIKNYKLTTDVGTHGDDMFKAPYVFANGVKTSALPKQPSKPKKTTQPKKQKTKIEKVIEDSNKKESKKKDIPNVTFTIPEDDAYKSVKVDEKNPTTTYLVTATTIGKTGKQLGWNKSNADKLKQVMLEKFAELEKHGIKIDEKSIKVFNTYKKFKGFNVFLHVKDDGTAFLTIDFQTKPTTVSGVYSQKRGKGSIDTKSAKTWLQTTLGLSDDQVLVTNGIMKGLHNETVYGVTNLACSSIVDSVYGFITLSKKSGKGLEYHEAWHYVNLLLHNRTMRMKIYEDYRSKHKELKDAKLQDIEESLAEDFRSYMFGFEDKSWSARIKRFFKNIKQIVKTFFGKPDIVYQAYKNIKNRKYVGAKLDQESINEFKRNYPDGVYFEIPGLTDDQVTKFTNIQNYHQYYQCAKLLCNKVMEGLDLSSVSKLKNYSKEDFDAIFDGIQQQIESDPESENSKLLQDVVNNKDAFYKTISTMLKTFSIDVKHKKLKLDADISTGKDNGDVADNIYDIDHMEVSKKINVGFKAKLFFSTIPMYDVKTDKNGNLQYVPNVDALFGSQNYWSFSKGWNKIMSELWNCDNFDAIDSETGQYTSTSLVRMVQRLSRSGDKFFHALEEKIEPLIDEEDESMSLEEKLEIKTQILNTIQSSKNRITVLSIDTPIKTNKKQDTQMDMISNEPLGEEVEQRKSSPDILIDVQKQWTIQDSEHLQSKYILARTWSENLLSGSGIVETDPKTGDMFISSSYMQKLKSLINEAVSATKKQGTQTQNFAKSNKYKSVESAKIAVCNVLNYMAIPADGQVLQQLINTELSLNPKAYPETVFEEKERHVLRAMLNGSGTATIQKLYGQLATANRGKTITIGKDGKKDLSGFYKGYSTSMSRVNGKKTTKGLPWVGKLTVAYAKTYPSSAEMSVTGANGAQIYPINQNNAVSDFLHRLQCNTDGELENKKATSYTQGSLIVQNAENDRVYSTPEEEKLHLNTFVCVKDAESGKSADYFGITPLEDYMAKFIMTYNKHLIFPTMADKKTWYSITSQWLTDNLNTDIIITNSEDPKLSPETIDIFSSYFVDELNSLKEYYSKENIKALLKNPNELLVNFHGKIVTDEYTLPNGKKYKYKHLNFDGNGGKFRYFYDISKNHGLNLNQQLELEYKTEQLENAKRASIGDVDHITDGFERIRKFLTGILEDNVESETYKNSVEQLRNSINAMLLEKVRSELDALSTDENIHLISHVDDHYINNGLPNDILKHYQNQIKSQYGEIDESTLRDSAIYSAVANHTLRTIMSIIEVEKIFTGDPAMYKWISYKDKQLSETTKNHLTREVTLEDGSKEKVSVSMLQSKDVDKIKRLGAVLSPGTNLKTQWTDKEKAVLKDFGTGKYTFMNTSDIKAKSIYLDNMRDIFTQNEIVSVLKRSFDDKYIIDHFAKVVGLDPKNITRVEKVYYTIYSHPEYIDKVLTALKNSAKSEVLVEDIQNRVKNSINPYEGITVADAEVCLRPSMYRKLRIATGEWSFAEDETGYSDEKAYNIIENEDDWMSDPEKYSIGRRLMLKPLKMSYFSNSTTAKIGAHNVSLPVYNKMAMFPMFKYVCQSETGKALYNRMNMPGNEIDMLGFESAVKVGCNQEMYTPYKKGVSDLSLMDTESLSLPSNNSINYQTGEIYQALPQKECLAVQIQDMNNLHLQLNTDAHESTERGIGTQMMKICFSNVDPHMRYGKDGQKGEGRLGSAIRNDIMNLVNAMTQIGTDNIKKRFFKKNKEGRYVIPNQQRIQNYILSICENNDLGLSSEEIIRSGGKVASLTARQIFEQSISSMVNKEVVDINTNGGAAVQQSCFGFVGYGKNNVVSEEQLKNTNVSNRHVLNDGKSLRWYNGKGTMEVMLSLNFFRDVIPEKYNTDYTTARQWLVDNDIINGTKSDDTQSDPKPYGVGYRIPTQGMSSTFGFIVADVLPETSGDLIIVPTEFTAQTGSDFDVDKLYMATYSYERNGNTSTRYKTSSKSDMKYVDYLKEDIGALRNKLLDDYIDIISDYKNTADARASIDVLTSKLKDEIIPYLSDQTTKYAESMYELLPSFQARRKMEYSTGKSGIGPFALNVTNLAMTQAVGLKMKFGKNDKLLNKCFDFGNINDVVGKDGYMISAWLSAMVNAHVDVAKDPYILNLNVNSATYKYTNFLLRTGQGMATFTLLAQPALKRMANMVINSKGMYGQKLGFDAREIRERKSLRWQNEIRGDLMRKYIKSFLTISSNLLSSENISEEQKQKLTKWKACIEQDKSTFDPNRVAEFIIKDEAKTKEILYSDEELKLLDFETAKSYLKTPQNYNSYEYARWCMFQALSLQFIGDISEAANLLSDLVSNSRIDTKKFGNNIISQMNFLNSYNNFKNDDDANKYFYIDDGREHKELPMYTYFEHTFLDKKLRNATQLTKSLLRNQSFSATPLFGKVFNSTMAAIFGDIVYRVPKGFDEKGKPIYDFKFGYQKVMSDDQVQAIGKALESIFRHRAFLAYNQIQDGFQEFPDLTFGGNEVTTRQKVIDLLYGNDKTPSLARRLSIMKATLKQLVFDKLQNNEQLPDWLQQLCDDNGVIKNEFLNYLNPILDKTGSYVDRIVLASSSMDIDSQDKSQLQSAFEELLSLQTSSTLSQDITYVKAIQNIARDLITYAYYTTYNNGGVNQFFELVPPTYRILYDNAMKVALRNGSNSDEVMAQSVLGTDIESDQFGALNVLNILDTLCKNFWKDENIVPTYTRRQKSSSVYSPVGEFIVKMIDRGNTLDNLRNIPIALALPIASESDFRGANTPYIKIEYGKNNKKIFLFKKVGTQYKVNYDKETGKETRYPFKNVYMITNKLSLQDGKNKQYEFFSDDNVSIFAENNLETFVGTGEQQRPGTKISLTEDEIKQELNIERSKQNEMFFKRLGKKTIRLEYEPYRPVVLDETQVVTSEQELQKDNIESSVLQDSNNNLSKEQPQKQDEETDKQKQVPSELSVDEQQMSDETQELQVEDGLKKNDPSLSEIGGELDLSSLLQSTGIDLSGMPQIEQSEMSEQDKDEAEQRKNDCKK